MKEKTEKKVNTTTHKIMKEKTEKKMNEETKTKETTHNNIKKGKRRM